MSKVVLGTRLEGTEDGGVSGGLDSAIARFSIVGGFSSHSRKPKSLHPLIYAGVIHAAYFGRGLSHAWA